jgi:ferredoxin
MHKIRALPSGSSARAAAAREELMRVRVNLTQCQGHARCEDICPEVFSTDAIEGKAVIKVELVPAALVQKVQLAVRNCPEGALRLIKDKESQ